ncbi:MAG: hypothetical protein OS130_10360 [Thermodesulfobacteriota bacterium]|nr:MAG: hypothetical protein OS130_10360 [Thermodesulfobacteriota bacterium]
METDAEGNLIIKTALTDIKHLKPIIGRINFKVHHLRKACDMTGILVC